MKRTLLLFSLAGFVVFAIWFMQDEAPLDYSSLEIPTGPNDPEINGYTLMRNFAADYETIGLDDVDLARQNSVEDWDIPALEAAITSNEELLNVFSKALEMEVFRFDQQPTPETLIPEVGDLRSYFRLRIAISRLMGHEHGPSQEIEELMQLSNQINTFSSSNGGLIHLLSSAAYSGILEKEYYRLLASD